MSLRHRVFLWALTLAAALGAAPALAQIDPCARYTNCQSCSAQSSCGWCGASNRCITGASGGSPFCTGGWAWNPPQCVTTQVPNVLGDRCASNNTCLSCAAQSGCGWCGAVGRCMSGTSSGSPMCPSAWAFTTAQCAVGMVPQLPVVDRCGRYSNCLQCAAQSGCGWCTSLNRCVPGNANGSPVCGGGWTFTPTQCAGHTPVPNPPGDRCGRYSSCGTCTPQRGCGWCGSLNRCISSTGVAGVRMCPRGWTPLPRSCPSQGLVGVPSAVINNVLNDPCTRNSSCGSCTSNGCTWCGIVGRCMGSGGGLPLCPSGAVTSSSQCQ